MELMHPNRSKMVQIALEVLPFKRESQLRALDLGAGTGYFAERFLARFPSSQVIAIDSAQSMLDLAKTRLGALANQVDFRIGDFRRLRELVPDKPELDLVYSSYALHHLTREDKQEVIRRAVALLRPSGCFLNADIIVAESLEVERRIQELRVNGIVARADGRDSRFRDARLTRRFLDELEAKAADQPLTLRQELEILRATGVREASVFWLEYREAVCGGIK